MRAVVLGPLLGHVIRAGLGGVTEKVFDLLLDLVHSLESFPLVAERSFLAIGFSAIVPKFFELSPWPATIKNSFEMRGRGREFFGGT